LCSTRRLSKSCIAMTGSSGGLPVRVKFTGGEQRSYFSSAGFIRLRFPSDPHPFWRGSRVIYPLSSQAVLIISHVEHASAPPDRRQPFHENGFSFGSGTARRRPRRPHHGATAAELDQQQDQPSRATAGRCRQRRPSGPSTSSPAAPSRLPPPRSRPHAKPPHAPRAREGYTSTTVFDRGCLRHRPPISAKGSAPARSADVAM
jgi:hypothetical protein